jgi:hypothetical protein
MVLDRMVLAFFHSQAMDDDDVDPPITDTMGLQLDHVSPTKKGHLQRVTLYPVRPTFSPSCFC